MGPVGTAARMTVLPTEWQGVLRFYLSHAPDQLPPPTPWPAADASGFKVRDFSPPNAPPAPAISNVQFVDVNGDGRLDILATEMRHGVILVGNPADPSGRLAAITGVSNPAHIEVFDVDRDGQRDLLIADLGEFLPGDHTNGAVVLMRAVATGGYQQLTLGGWPRVADVEGGDFDGDGRIDLAVAAFGWRKVGRMSVLENKTTGASAPQFVEHVIDPRPGGIRAIPVDLNGDGRLDIVGLLAQQFETVVAYFNTGSGFAFKPETIYTAPHPNWGSSGITLVDFDGDKDLDVLLTHGDTFDDIIIKPYHGIQWLENTGTYPFVEHTLADLPGVFSAKAGDLDGDGDLDVVACAFVPEASNGDDSDMPALVWLEQVRPGTFERHTLLRERPARHATLDLADGDGDGDLDILLGRFSREIRPGPWIQLWENQRKHNDSAVSSDGVNHPR
jgi:FG-GAP-like repeat